MLAALQKSGVSVVLTTHHLEEAEQRCRRIVIIDHGSIVAAGTVEELVQRTLGESRVASVTLDQPWPASAASTHGARLTEDRRTLQVDVTNLGRELPAVFDSVERAGRRVTDVRLTGATLHEVFIALTGRELRE
jgi:ABC-2 type transport system ATP-binding protein